MLSCIGKEGKMLHIEIARVFFECIMGEVINFKLKGPNTRFEVEHVSNNLINLL